MTNFSYRGRDAEGKAVEGQFDAASAAAVADSLLGRGITPLGIAPAPEHADNLAGGGAGVSLFKSKIEYLEVLLFTRQLHTLIKAGVPLMRALTGLQESASKPAMRNVLQALRGSLDSGHELWAAMARHPQVFNSFYLAMVRVGEASGRLEEVFLSLYRHLAFERFMRDQVKTALRYPGFVLAAMAVAIFVVNLFVIPAFARVFQGFGAQLPLMTRVLISFSRLMVDWWYLMIFAAAAAIFAFHRSTATGPGRLWWDRVKLSLPVAGAVIRKATLARFASSFAISTRSGVPITQALSNVALTVDNAFIAGKVEAMRDGVQRGESILRTAIGTGAFTPMVLQMIAVGEESGSLDEMLQEVADLYQEEVEYELKTLGQQIEPILIVLLGIMVLILALGIFLPIWDLGKVAIKH